jgi:hypothetical protein
VSGDREKSDRVRSDCAARSGKLQQPKAKAQVTGHSVELTVTDRNTVAILGSRGKVPRRNE